MQTQKWVNLGLLVAAFAVFLFLSRLLVTVWDLARLPVPGEWPVEPVYLLSFAVAATTGLLVRRSGRANGFFNEVALELSRVTWPGRKETIASAGVVAVLVGLVALILLAIDTLWRFLIRGALTL